MTSIQFLSDYLKAIDILALVALVALAGVAIYRQGNLFIAVLGVLAIIWAACRMFGLL